MNNKAYYLVWAACLFSSTTFAETARLDDSASARSVVEARSVTSETGRPLVDSASPEYVRANFGWVQYRLATAAYKGKAANIYYVIPLVINGLKSPHALTVTWKTNGQFNEGEGHAGDRKLVWSGTVTDDWMETEFDLQMQAELAQLRLPEGKVFGFESYFEIETNE